MKNFLKPLIVIVAGTGILVVGLATAAFFDSYRFAVSPPSALVRKTIDIGGEKVQAEISVTSAEQEKGLSGRAALAADAGMFFSFVSPGRPGFWMKGMEFALDFVYISAGRVVEIKESVQPTGVPAPFFPNEEVDGVLEVNAGWVSRHGIKIGDAVTF